MGRKLIYEKNRVADQQLIEERAFSDRVLERPESRAPFSALDDAIAADCEEHSICEPQLEDSTRNRRYAKFRAEIAKIASEAGVAKLSEAAWRHGRSNTMI